MELKEAITKFYSSDNDLIEKFHIIAGSGLEACVNRTVDDLDKVDITYIYDKEELIGYFATDTQPYITYLIGFFIMPEYRKDKKYWNEIIDTLPVGTISGLYNKNIRAQKLYIKQGYKILSKTVDGRIYRIK